MVIRWWFYGGSMGLNRDLMVVLWWFDGLNSDFMVILWWFNGFKW